MNTKTIYSFYEGAKREPANSRKTFYLESTSNHGFYLDNKYWPTLYHYINAARYPEVQDKICNAVSQQAIDFYTRPIIQVSYDPHGLPITHIHNNSQTLTSTSGDKSLTKGDLDTVIHQGIKAKFTQNKGLLDSLLDTLGYNIITRDGYGRHVVKFREAAIRENKEAKLEKYRPSVDDYMDMNHFNEVDIENIKNMIAILEKIRKMERIHIIYPEMIEDVIINILSRVFTVTNKTLDNPDYFYEKMNNKIIKVLCKTTRWVDNLNWSMVFTDMPVFNKNISLTRDILLKIAKRHDGKLKISRIDMTCAYILSFIRWIQMNPQFTNLVHLDTNIPVFLPMIARSYRTNKDFSKYKIITPDMIPDEPKEKKDKKKKKKHKGTHLFEDTKISEPKQEQLVNQVSQIDQEFVADELSDICVQATKDMPKETIGERLEWFNAHIKPIDNTNYKVITSYIESIRGKKKVQWMQDFENASLELKRTMLDLVLKEQQILDLKASTKKVTPPKVEKEKQAKKESTSEKETKHEKETDNEKEKIEKETETEKEPENEQETDTEKEETPVSITIETSSSEKKKSKKKKKKN